MNNVNARKRRKIKIEESADVKSMVVPQQPGLSDTVIKNETEPLRLQPDEQKEDLLECCEPMPHIFEEKVIDRQDLIKKRSGINPKHYEDRLDEVIEKKMAGCKQSGLRKMEDLESAKEATQLSRKWANVRNLPPCSLCSLSSFDAPSA